MKEVNSVLRQLPDFLSHSHPDSCFRESEEIQGPRGNSSLEVWEGKTRQEGKICSTFQLDLRQLFPLPGPRSLTLRGLSPESICDQPHSQRASQKHLLAMRDHHSKHALGWAPVTESQSRAASWPGKGSPTSLGQPASFPSSC